MEAAIDHMERGLPGVRPISVLYDDITMHGHHVCHKSLLTSIGKKT